MSRLRTEPRLTQPDDFYARLLTLHEDLSEAESHKVNASLILLLANHIGDNLVLLEAIQLVRASVGKPSFDEGNAAERL